MPATHSPDPAADVLKLARRLVRRERARQWLHGAVAVAGGALGTGLLTAAAWRWWGPVVPLLPVLGGLAAATVAAWAWLLWRSRGDAQRLLVRADRSVEGAEQLSTAYDLALHHPEHPFRPALLARCRPLLERVAPQRLVPIRPVRRDGWALAFVLVSLAAFLVPPALLPGAGGAAGGPHPAVAREGRRLERYAERLAGVAGNRQYERVGRLARAVQRTAGDMQATPMEREEAVRRVESLAETARELSAGEEAARPAGAADAPERPEPQGDGAGDTRDEPPDGFERPRADIPVETRDEPDPMAGQTERARRHPLSGEDARRTSQDGEMPRTMYSPDIETQRRVLEKAYERLTVSALSLSNQFSPRGANQRTSTQVGLKDSDERPINPDISAPGRQRPADDEGGESGGGLDPSHQKARTDPTAGSGAGPRADPEYEDVRAPAAPRSPRERSEWVRSLPELNARTVQATGEVPDFRRQRVRAEEGAGVPRSRRSLVKAYFLELERLRREAAGAAGDGASGR